MSSDRRGRRSLEHRYSPRKIFSSSCGGRKNSIGNQTQNYRYLIRISNLLLLHAIRRYELQRSTTDSSFGTWCSSVVFERVVFERGVRIISTFSCFHHEYRDICNQSFISPDHHSFEFIVTKNSNTNARTQVRMHRQHVDGYVLRIMRNIFCETKTERRGSNPCSRAAVS